MCPAKVLQKGGQDVYVGAVSQPIAISIDLPLGSIKKQNTKEHPASQKLKLRMKNKKNILPIVILKFVFSTTNFTKFYTHNKNFLHFTYIKT